MEEVEQQYDHLAQAGAYAEALDLVTREAHIFPDYAQKVIYSWRMTMASRLNDKALTLSLLKEAVEAGYWYGGLRMDSDFELLAGEAEFEQLVQICEERRQPHPLPRNPRSPWIARLPCCRAKGSILLRHRPTTGGLTSQVWHCVHLRRVLRPGTQFPGGF